MAERQHKYHGMPKSLFPQIRAQIAEREAALKVAIKQQEDLKITFEEKQNAALGEIEKSITELQSHIDEAVSDMAYINEQDPEGA